MSEYLQKIVYLTQSQYETLAGGGSITANGTTLTGINENWIYITDGNMSVSDLGDTIIDVQHGGTGKDTLLSELVLVGNGVNPITTIVKTNANTANTLVLRDSNGGFSAGSVTMTSATIGNISISGKEMAPVNGINADGGNMILGYKKSGTGVSTSLWCVGTVDIPGVIRSNANNLLHARSGTTYPILDTYNTVAPSTVPTLNWNTESTIFTLNGTAVKVKAMEKPTYAFTDLTSSPTTLSGYGITDAKIVSGVITLGSNTITPVTKVNGHTGNEVSVTAADLGLSNALHFIGITSTELSDGSTTATLTAKSTNSLSKTTGFVDGDVVMDGDLLREYVWSGSAWRLLGITTSTAYTQPASTATNTWIALISLGTDGKITATTGSLNTSGEWSGNAATATSANITSTANAVAYYTDTNATFSSKASANGALYATSTNGALLWGTLPIALGGTGVVSFTKNQVILSDNTNGTTGLTSRAYSDSTSAGALSSTSTNFVTERDIYYGLPILNNAHNYNSSSTYYAPTTGGTAGYVLIGAGTTAAPAWYGGTIMSGSATANWKTAFNGTTDATASNAAAVTIAGGLGIAKSVIVGDTATITNDTRSPKFTLTVNDTDKAYLQYNTTDDSIDFIFA